jgi:hypothetical protein
MPLTDAEVRSILGWRKTQHRVVLQPSQPSYSVGDRLWIQEAWADVSTDNGPALLYRSDNQYRFLPDETQLAEHPGCMFSIWSGDLLAQGHGWRDAIDMSRSASRITLEITDIRMQRLQDITWPDAVYEGMAPPENCFSLGPGTERPRDEFRRAWTSNHGAGAWDANPLVAALSFQRVSARTFPEIWERKVRWPKGPGLLTDIVLFLRDRSLVAVCDPHDASRVNITLPLPEIANERTGERTSVISMVPPELRDIFIERCRRILESRASLTEQLRTNFLSKAVTKTSLGLIDSYLIHHEREVEQRGEAQLWQVAAEEFGLMWQALPKPAGTSLKDRGEFTRTLEAARLR